MNPIIEPQTQDKKNIKGHKINEDKSMWGQPIAFWETVFFWAVWTAAIAGGISVTAAAISAVVGYRVTDIIQRESNERIAKAEQTAAEANLARMKIEEKLAPRSMNQSQQESLKAELAQFAGTSISIRIYSGGTPDTLVISDQIHSVLIKANWLVDVLQIIAGNLYVNGIIIVINNPNALDAAKQLVDGLNSVGIVTNLKSISPELIDANKPKGALIMLIGTKP
jgi:hypothetical protein